jgi:hypothetical protein
MSCSCCTPTGFCKEKGPSGASRTQHAASLHKQHSTATLFSSSIPLPITTDVLKSERELDVCSNTSKSCHFHEPVSESSKLETGTTLLGITSSCTDSQISCFGSTPKSRSRLSSITHSVSAMASLAFRRSRRPRRNPGSMDGCSSESTPSRGSKLSHQLSSCCST